MILFKNLFGCEPQDINKTCVVTPFLSKGLTKALGVTQMIQGQPFATGQGNNFTLIHTRIGASNVGDAILHLKNTSCENIILIGACGYLENAKNLKIGDLICPTTAHNYESFSSLLSKNYQKTEVYPANNEMLTLFQSQNKTTKVTCASFGSLELESQYINILKEKNVDVLDMECSSFFASANHIGRKAFALFYITDLIGTDHIFDILTTERQNILRNTQQKLFEIILNFTHTLSEKT